MNHPENTRCMILNPYTQTLKSAVIEPERETLEAILGTENIGFFQPKGASFSVLYNENIWNKLTGTITGTQFKGWKNPLFGMLLFMPPRKENSEGYNKAILSEEIDEIREKFKAAKKHSFKFSCH